MLFYKNSVMHSVILLTGLFAVFLIGCDRVARHRVLTFFFEGVPSLDSELPDSNEIVFTPQAPVALIFKNDSVRNPTQNDSSTHKPVKNCNKCHLEKQNWGQEQLIRKTPELCYSCHTDYSKTTGYLHGPVVVGACLYCHDPHQSKFIHLQTASQPDLCYQCHLLADILEIDEHQGELETTCTNCHDPHASSVPKLLKPYRQE